MGDEGERPEEWSVIESDTDETCAVCEEPLHAWQAVGRVHGQVLHAKCYRGSPARRAA
jgi:hypothetical protein